MPSAETILEGLREIANGAFALAVAWHIAIAVAATALALGWRPSRRLAGTLISLPAASVATLAIAHGNPFNAAMFGAVFVALVVAGWRLEPEPARAGPPWALALGVAMVAFAWVYPHFLEGRSALAYLYGAPTGLVPCPTLSLMIGSALVANGLGSRAFSLVLVAAGLFYGGFGAMHLGVAIDLGLLAGACGLLVLVATPRKAWQPARV